MAVFNGIQCLQESLDSILAQELTPIEVVIVNDGSMDGTGEILNEYKRRDSRVRVLEQENRGITQSLIRGCWESRGRLIARHDAGDVSSANRIKQQARILMDWKDVAIVSSWVRYVGPRGEPAGGIRHRPDRADKDLSITNPSQKRVRGPYHGAAMFRKANYEAVGGYRPEFYFAQDVDLWLRLHERGRHHLIPEELYTARLVPESISGRYRAEQDRCLELAVSAARARRAGDSEAPYLAQAARIRPSSSDGVTRTARLRAGSLYFMGCQLLAESPGSASRYFMRSLTVYPFNPKAWVRLVESVGRRCRLLS